MNNDNDAIETVLWPNDVTDPSSSSTDSRNSRMDPELACLVRSHHEPNIVFKDNDFNERIQIGPPKSSEIFNQVFFFSFSSPRRHLLGRVPCNTLA